MTLGLVIPFFCVVKTLFQNIPAVRTANIGGEKGYKIIIFFKFYYHTQSQIYPQEFKVIHTNPKVIHNLKKFYAILRF